jgi:hypothetical protein
MFVHLPLQDHEIYFKLGLVHCDVTATPVPQATFRMLDVGDATLRSCVKLALDDALGLVLLVNQEGGVTILSYAQFKTNIFDSPVIQTRLRALGNP